MAGLGAIGILGPLAGGFNSTFAPQLQQYQNDAATGEGLYAMMGMTPPQQQGGLGSLFSGGAPNVPVQAPTGPQLGQGGVAQSPMPQPAAVSVPAPALARGQPMTANAGQSPPMGQGQGAPSQTPPMAQPQQTAQLSPQLQNQQNAPQQPPDLSRFDGQFDFNHLMQNLVRSPGMNPQKLGRIARSPAFERMLNQEGLNQYRNLGLGIRADNAETARKRAADEAVKFARQTKEHALDREEQEAERQYSAQTNWLMFGAPDVGADGKPIDKQKLHKDLDDAHNKRIDDINKRRAALDTDQGSGGAQGGASDSGALEEAKAAIAAGRNKQMVIERFKKLHPDLDASALGQ